MLSYDSLVAMADRAQCQFASIAAPAILQNVSALMPAFPALCIAGTMEQNGEGSITGGSPTGCQQHTKLSNGSSLDATKANSWKRRTSTVPPFSSPSNFSGLTYS